MWNAQSFNFALNKLCGKLTGSVTGDSVIAIIGKHFFINTMMAKYEARRVIGSFCTAVLDMRNLSPSACIGWGGNDIQCIMYSEPRPPNVCHLGANLRISMVSRNAKFGQNLYEFALNNFLSPSPTRQDSELLLAPYIVWIHLVRHPYQTLWTPASFFRCPVWSLSRWVARFCSPSSDSSRLWFRAEFESVAIDSNYPILNLLYNVRLNQLYCLIKGDMIVEMEEVGPLLQKMWIRIRIMMIFKLRMPIGETLTQASRIHFMHCPNSCKNWWHIILYQCIDRGIKCRGLLSCTWARFIRSCINTILRLLLFMTAIHSRIL